MCVSVCVCVGQAIRYERLCCIISITYSQYSTCLEYLIAFIKRLPHNTNIKVNKICISATIIR